MLAGADGAPLVIAAGGFAQPSDEGAALLARRVDELARIEPPGAVRPRHVIELFAGSGTLSVLLARGAASFAPSRSMPKAAAAAARENLRARGLRARVSAGDADAFAIPGGRRRGRARPPARRRAGRRAGHRGVRGERGRLRRVRADDAGARSRRARRGAAWSITHVETFELFPQTSHVETVVRLERVCLGRGRPGSDVVVPTGVAFPVACAISKLRGR